MNDIVIHDFPGKQLRLEQVVLKGKRSQEELARSAASALCSFGEHTFEPASMDMHVVCCDQATGYPLAGANPSRPFWLFRRRAPPPGLEIRPAWTSEETVLVEELNFSSILDCMRLALSQECNPGAGEEIGWEEILFRAACVRLPAAVGPLADGSLMVRYGRGHIEHPIDRRDGGVWACGPLARKTLSAPIEIRIGNEAGLLTFDIWLLWSPWIEEQEGSKCLQHALDRLSKQGWVRRD